MVKIVNELYQIKGIVSTIFLLNIFSFFKKMTKYDRVINGRKHYQFCEPGRMTAR